MNANLVRSGALALLIAAAGCETIQAPQWTSINDQTEKEYAPYIAGGSGSIEGQAFLVQNGGGVVRAAGRTVTLDPVTTIGNEWWQKAGKVWALRTLVPPSQGFAKARRTTVADADGRFKFRDLAPGSYFLRTDVTWMVGYGTEGGLVGRVVKVPESKAVEVVLNDFPQ